MLLRLATLADVGWGASVAVERVGVGCEGRALAKSVVKRAGPRRTRIHSANIN